MAALPLFFDLQFFENSGAVAASYLLYTYENGTTTPLATYTDSGAGTPNANPIVLNSAGRCSMWLLPQSYSFELKTVSGSLVKRYDDVEPSVGISGLSNRVTATLGGGMVGYGLTTSYLGIAGAPTNVAQAIQEMLGSTTFTMYVNNGTGNDANNGTVGAPFKTLQKAFDIISALGTIGGTRVINVAAGTYAAAAFLSVKSKAPVQVLGVSGWVGTPTVIFDGGGSASTMLGARDGAKLYVQDIWFKNTTDNVVDAQNGSELYLRDCHSTDAVGASGSCVYIADNSRGYLNGRCLFKNVASSDGVILAYGGSIISVGQDGTSSADSPTINGTGTRGVKAQHQSLIKLRRAYVTGTFTYGVYSDVSSHISHEAGSVDNATLAYYSSAPGGILLNESAVTHSGITALRYATNTPGVMDRPIQTDDAAWRRVGLFVAADMTLATTTAVTTKQTMMAACLSLLAQDFDFKGRAFKIRVHGTITGVAGAKTFGVEGSVSGAIRTLVTNAADLGNFVIEFTTTALTTDITSVDILNEVQLQMDERSPQLVSAVSTKQLNQAQDIAFTITLANAADSVALVAIEAFQAGI